MRPRDLFPRHDFVIETSWPPSVAAIEIRKRIASPRAGEQGDEPFFGRSLSETEFRFSRAPSGKNLLPVIDATITPSRRGGARVDVRLRLQDTALVLTVTSMTVATLGPIAAVVTGGWGSLPALGVSALVVLGARWHHAAFSREALRTETTLRAIFAAAPGLPPPHETGEPYR
jgi:hypothetical protein